MMFGKDQMHNRGKVGSHQRPEEIEEYDSSVDNDEELEQHYLKEEDGVNISSSVENSDDGGGLRSFPANGRRKLNRHEFRKKGRPKLSQMSLPIIGKDLEAGNTEVTFLKRDDDRNPECIIDRITLPIIEPTELFEFTVKLAEGSSEIQKAINLVQLRAVEARSMNMIKAGLPELNPDVERKAKLMYIHPKYTELLSKAGECRVDKEEKVEYKGLEAKSRKIIEGVKLVIIKNFTIKRSAEKVGLAYTTLWREVAKYRVSPNDFCSQIEANLKGKQKQVIPTTDMFKQHLMNTRAPLPTKDHLANYLRENFMIEENLSNKKLASEAVRQYGLVKRMPKLEQSIKHSEQRTLGCQAFDQIICKFFANFDFVAIFDVTTFRLDKSSTRCWTLPGIRPNLSSQPSFKAVHVMCSISRQGVDMLVLKKGTITAIDIKLFFALYFEYYHSRRVILLDNAGVHRRIDLEQIGRHFDRSFVFNAPKNPKNNPVEWLFGVVKKKYAAKTVLDTKFCYQKIIEVFREVHIYNYHDTLRRCLSNI